MVFLRVRGFIPLMKARMSGFLARSCLHTLDEGTNEVFSSAFVISSRLKRSCHLQKHPFPRILIRFSEHTNQKQISHRNKEEDDD